MITSWVRMFWAIRISGFEIFGFFRILGPCGLNFNAIILKLGENDHLLVADVMGYSDIRISGYPLLKFSDFFGFFRILGPCELNFKAIMLKIAMNDHLMGADVLSYLDIRF